MQIFQKETSLLALVYPFFEGRPGHSLAHGFLQRGPSFVVAFHPQQYVGLAHHKVGIQGLSP
jgi:hypothetical protein